MSNSILGIIVKAVPSHLSHTLGTNAFNQTEATAGEGALEVHITNPHMAPAQLVPVTALAQDPYVAATDLGTTTLPVARRSNKWLAGIPSTQIYSFATWRTAGTAGNTSIDCEFEIYNAASVFVGRCSDSCDVKAGVLDKRRPPRKKP